MSKHQQRAIRISNASTHNLQGVSLDIPHNQLIVVTGVSGSGKSSLAFDIIAKEGQRRYFETLPTFARQFIGKISPANVDSIDGLSPVISVSQKTTGMNARSTVGTLTDIYAWLRLLYARFGKSDVEDNNKLTRSNFSFNAAEGKCIRCNGLGQEEEINLDKLIIANDKTIREGALAPTLPTGYIMYSQVTIDVLNQVCEAEGFNVDIPWENLTDAQKKVVLYGSEKIKVPFGKHSIESRLKWTGIKAKPREDGYYKGMIPIMSDILRRDRNANILKYVSAVTCKSCEGKRLNEKALSVTIHRKTIADLLSYSLNELTLWLAEQKWDKPSNTIIKKVAGQLALLKRIGLGYLTLNQPAKSLSGSEIQRIRVLNQIGAELSNVLYVFDEPSIGLHHSENRTMLSLLRKLVDSGNTVIVVEHDLETIKEADWIIDIGPFAGKNGGEILFNGPVKDFLNQDKKTFSSPTLNALFTADNEVFQMKKEESLKVQLSGCQEGRLKSEDYSFLVGQLNVVTGPSGSGKKDLVIKTLLRLVDNHLKGERQNVAITSFQNIDKFDRLIYADQSPIGRTPRSNPATYLGLSDHIRDLFSKLPEAKTKKLTKSSFSFNTKGGRCETCKGAGKTQIGMHFLGQVDLTCETCDGKRFNSASLSVKYKGKTIADIYELNVNEAKDFLWDQANILSALSTLQEIGLGYLLLGQSATTLSGGEAQRIKLANELQKKSTGNTLYIIDEPSIGLHRYDIANLLKLFQRLIDQRNTIVCIEQDDMLVNRAAHTINLGGDGESSDDSKTESLAGDDAQQYIRLKGVKTNQLKSIDVAFPKNKITVVTGVSGSGKSSLVYESLYSEADARFSESLSTYNRSLIQSQNRAEIDCASGLTPTIALQRKNARHSNRSTVATVTGIHDHLRLLFSRLAQLQGETYSAQHFSFNHKLGACPQCKGQGIEKKCDPYQIVIDPNKSIFEGALNNNNAAKYFTNLDGQFIATLKTVADFYKWELNVPYKNLSKEVQGAILYGTGDKLWDVHWEFKTKTRTGSQELTVPWLGLCHYINDEFERRRNNKNIQPLLDLLHDVNCDTCKGDRLKNDLLHFSLDKKNIAEICGLSVHGAFSFFREQKDADPAINSLLELVLPPILRQLKTIIDLGIGYLSLDRITGSLSGGETQRIKLAGQLSANLYGITYVLDEPSIGLDELQIRTLINLLETLTEKGNTIVVIEHDPTFVLKADHIIEMGPSSGINGGKVTFQGALKSLEDYPDAKTNILLNNQISLTSIPENSPGPLFGVKGAFKNNLKNLDIGFVSNNITALIGPSGSGKSSLMKDVLYDSYKKRRAIGCSGIYGLEHFEDIFIMDQQPIALNGLTSPVNVSGVLDILQIELSKTAVAKSLALKKADFSYQSKTGKCPNCKGYGELKTTMDYMADVWIPCKICKGSRYSQSVNECQIILKDIGSCSIGELMRLSFAELFGQTDNKKLNLRLKQLIDVGLGHLKLGQPGNRLSGGEGQRLKLIRTLQKSSGNNLYLFDEPSNGLHQLDLTYIRTIFHQLIEEGHTVIFIDHNPKLIDLAHHKIKLGPGSGEMGGRIVSEKN